MKKHDLVTDWSKKDAVPIRTAAGLTKTMASRTEATIKEEPLPRIKSDVRDFYKNVIAAIEGRENCWSPRNLLCEI